MLSRVAENLYWMARYIERSENTARQLSVTTNLLLDLPQNTPIGWDSLLAILAAEEAFAARYETTDETQVVHFLSADRDNPGSILSSLAQARENLRTVRDVVPREAWEQVNTLFLEARKEVIHGINRNRRHDFLKRIILGCQQLTGLLAGCMSHDIGYSFARTGRNLERADMTSRILDIRSRNLLSPHHEELPAYENIQWMSVLKSVSAYQMYRQHFRIRVRGPEVLRFLLQNQPFPRTVNHCLHEIFGCLEQMPRSEGARAHVRATQLRIAAADIGALAEEPEALRGFIDSIQLDLARLHQSITETWFHPPAEPAS